MNPDNDSDIDLAGGINQIGSQLAGAIDAFRNASNTVRNSATGTAAAPGQSANYTPIIIGIAAIGALVYFLRK